jgi:hypothetical protein
MSLDVEETRNRIVEILHALAAISQKMEARAISSALAGTPTITDDIRAELDDYTKEVTEMILDADRPIDGGLADNLDNLLHLISICRRVGEMVPIQDNAIPLS